MGDGGEGLEMERGGLISRFRGIGENYSENIGCPNTIFNVLKYYTVIIENPNKVISIAGIINSINSCSVTHLLPLDLICIS